MPGVRDRLTQNIPPLPAAPERRQAIPASPSFRYYTIYGLTIASQLALPELETLPPVASPDILIRIGNVADHLEGAGFSTPWLESTNDRCQFLLEGIARFRVEQGKHISVDRRLRLARGSTTNERDLRVYLLGTALGALLHQRHWMPLHISAVETPSGIWGFTGNSGAGKSTLAAWLHYQYGWKLVSDDVGVIKPEEGLPTLYPGPRRLKLWKDALERLSIERQGLIRDLTRTDKFHLNQHQGFKTDIEPLRVLVMLERGSADEEACVEAIEGVEAFRIVMSALYLPEWGQRFNGPARLMQYGADLARQIRVYRYRRPWSLERMEQSLAPLLQRIHADARHDD
ncbi:hypothetical protein [Halomonas korlensis]|uniref:Hpr(Ser) kinase/phosphatase n=1 Tax=Halomonas korlensis TaxID=463301 RepID=A0A1I7FA43_9GAMM|nr:hypothetical protein [Halomonas korlensis]SFU33041.1 hypothetical protein SAMN04487955_101339 [Halomonas korlensis]